MGLAEKKAIAAYQQGGFVEAKKAVDAAAGFPVEMDIRWDTMAEPNQGDRYPELYGKVFFTPLTNALKAIAGDDMGKEALKAGLKKVVIDGSEGINPSGFTFDGGVLTLKHHVFSNIDDIADRTKGIQKLIEAKL